MRTGVSWLDVKLGLRMLVRYPGLSLAGGLGIAIVIVCGMAAAVFDAVVNGTLPCHAHSTTLSPGATD